MPEYYHSHSNIIRPLTPKQLKAKMDREAKKASEKYRLISR